MTVVADASLAVKWGVQEEHTEEAVALRNHWRDAAELVIAPPLFRPEVANALHQYVRRGELAAADAAEILETLLPAVETSEPARLYSRAMILAVELGLTATYDALYVALAELEVCEMWTADRRLVRSAQSQFPYVRWVGEAR